MSDGFWTLAGIAIVAGIAWLWGFGVGWESSGRHHRGLVRFYRARVIDLAAGANRRADQARLDARHDRVVLSDEERERIAELDEGLQR